MTRALMSSDQADPTAGDEYATSDDLQTYFALDMTELFRLALLLTADAVDAERCVILAIQECLSGVPVFKEWLHVWVRRTIVRNGISVVTGNQKGSLSKVVRNGPVTSIPDPMQLAAHAFEESAGIVTLDNFERLVYVLSILEHYSITECALLLGRTHKEVREARNSAVARVAVFEQEMRGISGASSVERSSSTWSREQDGFDCSCGTLLE